MSVVRTTLRATKGTEYRRPGGPWDTPSLDARFSAAAAVASVRSTSESLRDGELHLPTSEVEALVATLAGGLADLGVERRDVVAWQLDNGYEAVLLARACWRLGAIVAPIAPDLDEPSARELFTLLEPRVVIASAALPLGHCPDVVMVGGPSLPARRGRAPEPSGATAPAVPPFAKLLTAEARLRSAAQPSDVAAVITSGTGAPGVVHTHRTLATIGRRVAARLGLTAADTVAAAQPLWQLDGLVTGVVAPGLVGARTLLLPVDHSPATLELVERERVAVLHATPAAIDDLGRDPDFRAHRLRSLRAIDLAGPWPEGPLVPDAAAHVAATCRVPAAHSFGSPEAPDLIVTEARPDAPVSIRPDDQDHEVRVVDPGSGRDAPVGEIWVRGPDVFAGYLTEADTRARVARGGWFRTGWPGTRTDHGVVRSRDRAGS